MNDLSVFQFPGDQTEYEVKDAKARANEADDFSISETYDVGDYCLYDGVLYRCINAHDQSSWVAADFVAVKIVDEMKDPVDVSTKANRSELAPAFDVAVDYYEDDLVVYNNQLYKCINDHTAGAWVAADFAATTISDSIKHYTFTVNNEKLTIAEVSV